VLPLLPDWKIVYSDSTAVVLERSPVQGAAEMVPPDVHGELKLAEPDLAAR